MVKLQQFEYSSARTQLTHPESLQQGIIAPKIEISTNTVIEEVKTIYDANLDGPYVVNPKTIDSKVRCICDSLQLLNLYLDKSRFSAKVLRSQKTSRQRYHQATKSLSQSCQGKTSDLQLVSTILVSQFSFFIYQLRLLCLSTFKATWSGSIRFYCRSTRCCNDVECSCQDGLARTSEPYHHPMKHDICVDTIDTELDPSSRYRRVPSVCENLHIFDSCPVCFKYKCYFSSKCDKLLDRNSANGRARLQRDDSVPRQPTST